MRGVCVLLVAVVAHLVAAITALCVLLVGLELALRLGGGDPLATALCVIGIAGAAGWLADWRRST